MFNKLKNALKQGILGEFVRYTLVGGLCFVVDYSTLLIFNKLLKVNYLVAAIAGFLFGLLCNYVGSTKFVFKNRVVKDRRLEWTAFAVIGLVGLALNEGLLFLLTGKLKIGVEFSKPMTQAVVFLWNFAARKALLFANVRQDKSGVL